MVKKLSLGRMLVGMTLALLGCKKDKWYVCADEYGDVKSYCSESADEALNSCLRDPSMGYVCACTSTGQDC